MRFDRQDTLRPASQMAAPLKVLIVGGSIDELPLALMLEPYGFEFEMLEKQAEVAPQLGAGVRLFPNGTRILDQTGMWDMMCDLGCPIDEATAVPPEATPLNHNAHLEEYLKKLFGYKIQFLPHHKCLNVVHSQIRNNSAIHMKKELTNVSFLDGKVRVETKDGLVYTGDILVGADGVRSRVRQEVWRISDSEQQGYISQQEKTAIGSSYTAVVGVARDVPHLPIRASASSYNPYRSYFFQGGHVGSEEIYWWLCIKNEKKQKGVVRGIASETREALVNKYGSDKIWPSVALGGRCANSVYSFSIPLEEFVLDKRFYKNILLLRDSFRKLHLVVGQGANSALEESAFFADLLSNLRSKNALHDSARIQQAFSELQEERHMRLTALRDDAHDIQCLESLDTPVHKVIAMQIMPSPPFEKAFSPRPGASFPAASAMKHLPPPKIRICAFASKMKAKPRDGFLLATLSWISVLLFAAAAKWRITIYAPNNTKDNPTSPFRLDVDLYISFLEISITALWLSEFYCADSLVASFCSATLWILSSTYWGWEKTFPIYLSLHIALRKGICYYQMPRTMADFGATKALPTALNLVYIVSLYLSLTRVRGLAYWGLAYCAFPIVAYVCGKILITVRTIPARIDVIFSSMDIPSQKAFHNTIRFVAGAWHIYIAFCYGPELLMGEIGLLPWPSVGSLLSLVAVTTTWCFYATWDVGRVSAIDTSLVYIWVDIILSTVVCGPAFTLIGTWMWRTTQLAKVTSFPEQIWGSNGTGSKRKSSTKRVRFLV